MISQTSFISLFHPDSRLASFGADWPLDFENVSPRKLADNGFVYLGNEDHVKCFACGKELQNWEETDNIVEEHQRRNECLYLNYLKSGGSAYDMDLKTALDIAKEIHRRTIVAIESDTADESDLKTHFNSSKPKGRPKKKV
ncbi:death-associated inhibitor of apoptosis 1 [Galendromus occidentalis]|uniref:Death-associated inhibitor of apoptosis 1 n=1 Tax=Galendromus occidentalis TaxID=34638 RepID=A0AAJ6QNN2_9ACAR|nr:death-associated inhibitor of apoptosis 1 [Galendromus occidentalis]